MSYPSYGYDQGGPWPHHDNYYYSGGSGGRSRSSGRGGGRYPPAERGGGPGGASYYDQPNAPQYGTSSSFGGGYSESKGRDPHREGRDYYYGNGGYPGDYEYDRRRPLSGVPPFDPSSGGGRSSYRGAPPPSHYESRNGPASSHYPHERSSSYYSSSSYSNSQPYFYSGNGNSFSSSSASSSHSFYDNYPSTSYYHSGQYASGNPWHQGPGGIVNGQMGSERSPLRGKLERPKLTDSPTKLRQYSFGSNKRKVLTATSKVDGTKSIGDNKSKTNNSNVGISDISDEKVEEEIVAKEPEKIKDPAIEKMLKLSSLILDHKISMALLALNLKLGDQTAKENVAQKLNITTTGAPVVEAKQASTSADTPRLEKNDRASAVEYSNESQSSGPALKRSISDGSVSSAKKARPNKPPSLADPNSYYDTQKHHNGPPKLKPPSKLADAYDNNFSAGPVSGSSSVDTPSRKIADNFTPQKSFDPHPDNRSRFGPPHSAMKESRTPRDPAKDSLRDTPRHPPRDVREPFRDSRDNTPRGDFGRDGLARELGRDNSRDAIRDARDFPPRDTPRDSRDARDPYRGVDGSRGPGFRGDHDYYHGHSSYSGSSDSYLPTAGDSQYDYYQRSQQQSSHWSYDNGADNNFSRGRSTPQSHGSGGGGSATQDRYSYYNYPSSYNDSHHSQSSGSDRGYYRGGNDFNGRGPPPGAPSPNEYRNPNATYDRGDYWGNDGQRSMQQGNKPGGGSGSSRKPPPPLRTPR